MSRGALIARGVGEVVGRRVCDLAWRDDKGRGGATRVKLSAGQELQRGGTLGDWDNKGHEALGSGGQFSNKMRRAWLVAGG